MLDDAIDLFKKLLRMEARVEKTKKNLNSVLRLLSDDERNEYARITEKEWNKEISNAEG